MRVPALSVALLALLTGSAAPIAAQIADYGAAQLARQAVDIRAPYLAQMAQIRYQQQTGQTSSSGTPRRPVDTTFERSTSWFKPWSMANEIATKVEWDPKAPLGAEFAREEAQRQALTKLFTDCLDAYDAAAKAEGLPTDDLAVTVGHAVALTTESTTGKRIAAPEDAQLRQKLQDEFAHSDQYWTDADKQAVHDTFGITTMLAVTAFANSTRDGDAGVLAMLRDT